ncbi:MAG: NAD+ synthase [Firmicutes bacterium]|uniref:Glutamine-dependent NAD(+) synthetase n=1 Tax=Sulfobacillus benefaciens TaxID=453960 RepID=A0A2T2X6X2_9FIRM|nr:NAD+ synthase [Bacillota bacterium]MCL5013785.1 NAD+ synthase [Bacillota bacterium]PSR30254.1 MAG: NAD+ synthase [Sulfobacillus benefaciens]HBQ94717.1 NAD+ synthase [Sulfobacillus sp.]
MNPLNIRLIQMNSTVGDIEGNRDKIVRAVNLAKREAVDIVVFPEMALPGYPPEDLIFRPDFLQALQDASDTVVKASVGIMTVFGTVYAESGLFNSAIVAHNGTLLTRVNKQLLPNYGVFDEARYFKPGQETKIIVAGEWSIGISICEDIWYPDGPYLQQARHGANLLINISASPYSRGKQAKREHMLQTRADDVGAYLVWNNLTGAQDELVFDGVSAVYGPDGHVVARAQTFEEDVLTVSLTAVPTLHRRFIDPRWRLGPVDRHIETIPIEPMGKQGNSPLPPRISPLLIEEEELYRALVVGVRDYVEKNRFPEVVIGLSGGIDSALTAVIAVDALGLQRVHGVLMPSPITSQQSLDDAWALVHNLGIHALELAIGPVMESFDRQLQAVFQGLPRDITEENLQARIRGTLLMALSNKFRWLVLTTGNKSEMATGYSTLYGDMAGGFAVLKDVLKTQVFQLARWINRETERIPGNILVKPPSAELRPDQKDEDSLPPYAILDRILEGYIEDDLSLEQLVAEQLNPDFVAQAIKLVNRNEYKRRQAPIGIKVTSRAFGRDRRMPITRRFE